MNSPNPAAGAPAAQSEGYTMDGIASDKVNIHVGGSGEGGGGGYGAGLAAVIAALGNRNQGDATPALIAALGNRNEHRRDEDGFGFGGAGGILGLVALLGLLRGRGGLGGDEGCCDNGEHGRTAILQTLMEGQSDLRAAVPQTGLETQNSILGGLAQLALGTQQGLSNVKDSVQSVGSLIIKELCDVNQNVSAQGCQTREVVLDSKATLLLELKNNRIGELEDRVRSLDNHSHVRDSEVRVSQIVNQNQQQQQQQQQLNDHFSRLFGLVSNVIGNQVVAARSNQDIVNLGTMLASGTQTPTNVNQR